MAPVRSRRLWSASVSAGATQLVYTVPADRTAIARSIWFNAAGSALAVPVRMVVNAGGGGLVAWLGSIPSGSSIEGPYWVGDEGDTVSIVNNGAATLFTVGYGSLLDGDPS